MERIILSRLSIRELPSVIDEIYQFTKQNEEQYPHYYDWFYQTSIPRIVEGLGEIIFYEDSFQIAGLSILKRDSHEDKICTLKVAEPYRRTGLSRELLEESFEYLKTTKPLMTIPKKKVGEFSGIIRDYDWQLTATTNEYYTPENIYNGTPYIKRR